MPGSGAVACDSDPECGDLSAWAVFTRVVLKQASPSCPAALEMSAAFDREVNDIVIEVDTKESDPPTMGTVAMVGGRVMLTKGMEPSPGY